MYHFCGRGEFSDFSFRTKRRNRSSRKLREFERYGEKRRYAFTNSSKPWKWEERRRMSVFFFPRIVLFSRSLVRAAARHRLSHKKRRTRERLRDREIVSNENRLPIETNEIHVGLYVRISISYFARASYTRERGHGNNFKISPYATTNTEKVIESFSKLHVSTY